MIKIPDLPEMPLENASELSLGLELENDGNGEAKNTQEQEDILDWSTVDVPGSPKLSRLFKALQIESSKSIPPISLDNTTSDEEETTCLSGVELKDLFNEDNKGMAVNLVLSGSSSREQKRFVSFTSNSGNQRIHYPWRDVEGVFCGYQSPSPFNEMYVFPPSGQTPKPKLTAWATRKMREKELEAKIGKLKMQFPIHHAAVAAVMDDLAYTYVTLGKHRKAESLYRSLVDVYLQTSGPTNLKTLMACRDVIDSISQQGRLSEAHFLHQNLRSAIYKHLSPTRHLALWARWVDGHLARMLGQEQRAEIVYREDLQILLGLKGAKHLDTLKVMRGLVYSIAKKDPEGAEKLAQNTVQLCLESQTTEEYACFTMSTLAYTLYKSSRYGESCSVAKSATQMITLPRLKDGFRR